MHNLIELDSFVTFDEAVKYLSNTLSRPVSLLDVHQFIMNKELMASVLLLNQEYVLRRNFTFAEGEDINSLYERDQSGDEKEHFTFDEEPYLIDGVWDIPMIGSASVGLKREYRRLLNEESDFSPMDRRIFLMRGEQVCKLQMVIGLKPKPVNRTSLFTLHTILLNSFRALFDKVFPRYLTIEDQLFEERLNEAVLKAKGHKLGPNPNYLLGDSDNLANHSHKLVIKTKELLRFVQDVTGKEFLAKIKDKKTSGKEQKTELKLIKALLAELSIDPLERGVAPAITLITENSGTPLAENTVRRIIKDINDL